MKYVHITLAWVKANCITVVAGVILLGSLAALFLLIGPNGNAFIEQLDVTSDVERSTIGYAPNHISADRLQRLVESVISPQLSSAKLLLMHLDAESNRLFVTAPQVIQEKVREAGVVVRARRVRVRVRARH